jgi:hypothetical protein
MSPPAALKSKQLATSLPQLLCFPPTDLLGRTTERAIAITSVLAALLTEGGRLQGVSKE